MVLLLLITLGCAAIVWVHLKCPKTNSLVLKSWPSPAWLYSQVALTMITKGALPDRVAAIATVPKLKVSLLQPQAFNASRLQRFLALAGFAKSSQKVDLGAVPLMYPIVESFKLLIQALLLPGFPFKVLGSVLARNTTTMYRAIRPDEALLYSVRIEPSSWRTTPKGDTEVDVMCEAVSPTDAQLVWRSTTTSVILNPKRQRSTGPKSQAPAEAINTSWEVVNTWQLGPDTGRKYGMLNGDLNPIHLYPPLSMLFGFKRPIAHALFLVAMAEASLKASGIKVASYPVKLATEFKRPTLLPAVLKLGVQKPEAAAGAPVQKFAVLTEDGAKEVLTGTLACGLDE